MSKIVFIKEPDKVYDGQFSQIGEHQVRLIFTDNIPSDSVLLSGFNLVNEYNGVVKNVFTTLSTKVNENVAGFKNLEQQVASTKAQLQRQLNVAKAMGMDESVINSLQAKLNSLNVNNFKQNIAGVKQAFQDLGVNSVNNISKLQNAINTLQNRLNYIKDTKMDIVKPSDGKPIVTPSQDMILGNYYLTLESDIAFFKEKASKLRDIGDFEEAEKYDL